MNKAKSDSIFTKSMKAPEVCIIAQTSGVLFVHIYNIKIKRENLTGACAIFAQSRINPTQAKRNKIPYRLRPCPIYVQARCSDGRCPSFAVKPQKYPARALPLTRQEVRTPWTPTPPLAASS